MTIPDPASTNPVNTDPVTADPATLTPSATDPAVTNPEINDPANTVYIAEFVDGPLETRTDRRVLVDGKHESRISMVAAIDSMESLFWYDEVDSRAVQGQLHVRYAFDAGESDPLDSNNEPETIQPW